MTSNIKYSFTLFALTLYLLIQGCSNKPDYLTGKTISIPCNQADFDEFAAGMGFASFDSLLLMCRCDMNSNTLEIQNLITHEAEAFTIPEMVREILTKKADYRLISPDTVAFYSWIDQNLLLWDIKNNTLDNINLNELISSLDSTLVPLSSPIFPFQIKDNIIVFTNSYTNLVLNKKSNIKEYFNKKSLTCINLSYDDYSAHIFGEFPGSYRAGNLYSDPYAKSCLNNKQQVICSYSSSDTISIYSLNGEHLHNSTTKSKYALPFQPRDLEKNLDSKYNMEYALTNGSYRQLIYDSYRNCYYRIYKHPVSVLNSDGKIRNAEEIPWSMIILDSNFRQIKEILFDPAEFSPMWIIPTDHGVYISQSHAKNKGEGKFSLMLVKF